MSKYTWPCKNLYAGGGPSRPFHKISITGAKKYGGPTKANAKVLKAERREMKNYVREKRAILKQEKSFNLRKYKKEVAKETGRIPKTRKPKYEELKDTWRDAQ